MTDILQTLKAELDEGVALLRSHYPGHSDEELRWCAEYWRFKRYKMGRWPSAQEIEEHKARMAAEKAAAEAAEKAAAEKAA